MQGIGFSGPVEEISIKDVKNVLTLNFFGQIDLIQNVLPIMWKNNYGLILNITSIAGFHGIPFCKHLLCIKSIDGVFR